ncbi:MAG: hypothetical protein ACOC2U_00245 [bacterium]
MSKQLIKAFPEEQRPLPDKPMTEVLNVSEFFYDTIQGEGINTGVPAIFLRLQDCTLNCIWCFGVKPGRRVPRVTTLNRSNKKINEVKVGDTLLTFDEKTKKLVETKVKKVISRKVTKWREIKIENTIYYVTPEHPFFMTDGSLKTADKLKTGDEIYHSSSKQKMSYLMKKNNPMYDKELVEKSKINTDWQKLVALNGFKVIYNKEVDITTDKYYGKSYGPKELEVFNLSCAPYNTYLVDNMWVHNCDTTEVWRQGNPYSIQELTKKMYDHGVIDRMKHGHHLVLTGGSPLKQQFQLVKFLEHIEKNFNFKPYVEIENECTLKPHPSFIYHISCWNNSPKLSNSLNTTISRYKPEVLELLSNLTNSWFKFVITEESEWEEIERDFLKPGLILNEQIILMPEGEDRTSLNRSKQLVVEMAIKHSVRYCSREHIVLWDKATGV